jgi:hypothetical protein
MDSLSTRRSFSVTEEPIEASRGESKNRFLLDQKQEQEAEQITHNTLASYRSMICQHSRPKWGDAYLKDVRSTLVQDWLRRRDLSPKYKGHIRSLM